MKNMKEVLFILHSVTHINTGSNKVVISLAKHRWICGFLNRQWNVLLENQMNNLTIFDQAVGTTLQEFPDSS